MVKSFNKVSKKIQKVDSKDSYKAINLSNMMHGFIVTNQFEATTLSVCEATRKGVKPAKIQVGDTDWTSMILFIPRDSAIADRIVINANNELQRD